MVSRPCLPFCFCWLGFCAFTRLNGAQPLYTYTATRS
uniref:Uncharacterized protein n=1 Tax=Anopheles albimanus TaxID=7167 RepID=A0A182FY78_ANOAL